MDIKSDEVLNTLRDESYLPGMFVPYQSFKGCILTVKFAELMKAIDEFEVYDDDVWLTSFPKCGTTWAQEMTWCICNNLDFEGAKENLMTRFPFIEYSFVNGKLDQNSVEMAKNIKRPRFIKSHLPWDLLPKEIRTFQKRPKIIHIVREPKDACVSFYHHSRLLTGYTGDFDLFCQLFLKHKLIWTPYSSNVLSYWNRRNESNIHIIKYEDMKKDLPGVIAQTAEFLNVKMTEGEVTKLLPHLSFEVMKKNPAVNVDTVIEFLKSENHVVNPEGQFIRKGTVGDYKTIMNPQVVAAFDEEIGSLLKQAGLIF